jgi:acetyl esterase/lipase
MGASAGGHLACLAAVTATAGKSESKKEHAIVGTDVKAVAAFFPPTDFLDFGGKPIDARAGDHFGQVVRQLAFPQGLGSESESEISDKLKQNSPARLVTPQAPPFLLIHGDADPVVPLQQCERMLAVLKRAGVSAELIVKHGGGHPWLTLPDEVQVVADWFDRHLEKK